MFDFLLCGNVISCHLDNIKDLLNNQKYSKDHEVVCKYFKEQKVELPDYCFYKTEIKKPRHRSEY